ncbi:hypothetical protein RirG_161760 [Rhizophagus irregularis DAOM 197198w]|uniref:Uncharacterized protein n=1 Tax=Rhizophagus irregularis (strain DAOM 197198w) TaxID=1432141 RepID=A0A015IYS5_RHIIW|nr:hypothetical protein RirG_161760 [Rhizophagus irregularis DAOM 197198w]
MILFGKESDSSVLLDIDFSGETWPGDAWEFDGKLYLSSLSDIRVLSLFFGLKLDSREESITDDPGDACGTIVIPRTKSPNNTNNQTCVNKPSRVVGSRSFQKKFQAIVFPEPGRVRPDSQFSASLNFDGRIDRYNELDLEYFFIGLASFGTDDILI